MEDPLLWDSAREGRDQRGTVQTEQGVAMGRAMAVGAKKERPAEGQHHELG